MRQSYGNVYSLFLGLKPAVVISEFKAMKEAMVIKAADFAGRPQNILITNLTNNKGNVQYVFCNIMHKKTPVRLIRYKSK